MRWLEEVDAPTHRDKFIGPISTSSRGPTTTDHTNRTDDYTWNELTSSKSCMLQNKIISLRVVWKWHILKHFDTWLSQSFHFTFLGCLGRWQSSFQHLSLLHTHQALPVNPVKIPTFAFLVVPRLTRGALHHVQVGQFKLFAMAVNNFSPFVENSPYVRVFWRHI